jgi:hypothetical protein
MPDKLSMRIGFGASVLVALLSAILLARLFRREQLLAGLGEEQITAVQLPSTLSIKDVIAHLRAWQQTSITALVGRVSGLEGWFYQVPKSRGSDP